MNIQTKCTWVICGLFIIEILPMPVSSLYGLYAVRKRPDWLLNVVEALYAGKPVKEGETVEYALPVGHNPLAIRKRYTIMMVVVFLVDLLIPVVVPSALWIVRIRPVWFKNLVLRLYSDKLQKAEPMSELSIENPQVLAELKQKLVELERKNLDFAKSLGVKAFNSQLNL